MRALIFFCLVALFLSACTIQRKTSAANSASLATMSLGSSAFYAGERAPAMLRLTASSATPPAAGGTGDGGFINNSGGTNSTTGDGGVISNTPTWTATPTSTFTTLPTATFTATPLPTTTTPANNGGGNGGGTGALPTPTATPSRTTDGGGVTGGANGTASNGDGGNLNTGGNNNGGSDNGCVPGSTAGGNTDGGNIDVKIWNVCTWHYEALFYQQAQHPILTLETFPLYLDDGSADRCLPVPSALAKSRPVYAETSDAIGDYMNSLDPLEGEPLYLPRGLAFYVYTAATPGCDLPLYRCRANSFHYQSNDPACEGNGTQDMLLGYVCKTQMAGTSPLYRMRYGGNPAHFSATDFTDVQAHTGWGWYIEGVTGFAPVDPDNSQNSVVVAKMDVSGHSYYQGKDERSLSVNLAPLRQAFPQSWNSRPLRARICDDRASTGSCNGADHYSTVSLADMYLTAAHLPTTLSMEVFGTQIGYDHDYYDNLPAYCERLVSPLVISLDGQPLHLTGPQQGVQFDLDASGTPAVTGWTIGANAAFLARDLNHNGQIGDGSELFGSATRLQNGEIAADGFAALRDLDSDGDGFLTPKDRAWGELVVWADRNRDGLSEPGELRTLDQAGIRSIDLHDTPVSETDPNGNQTRLRSTVQVQVGGTTLTSLIVDIWFNTLVVQ